MANWWLFPNIESACKSQVIWEHVEHAVVVKMDHIVFFNQNEPWHWFSYRIHCVALKHSTSHLLFPLQIKWTSNLLPLWSEDLIQVGLKAFGAIVTELEWVSWPWRITIISIWICKFPWYSLKIKNFSRNYFTFLGLCVFSVNLCLETY